MDTGAVQNGIVGIVFVLCGLALLIVPSKRLPSFLQLETFARHRVLFAIVTIAFGAFVAYLPLKQAFD
jgi:hypothetical protein